MHKILLVGTSSSGKSKYFEYCKKLCNSLPFPVCKHTPSDKFEYQSFSFEDKKKKIEFFLIDTPSKFIGVEELKLEISAILFFFDIEQIETLLKDLLYAEKKAIHRLLICFGEYPDVSFLKKKFDEMKLSLPTIINIPHGEEEMVLSPIIEFCNKKFVNKDVLGTFDG